MDNTDDAKELIVLFEGKEWDVQPMNFIVLAQEKFNLTPGKIADNQYYVQVGYYCDDPEKWSVKVRYYDGTEIDCPFEVKRYVVPDGYVYVGSDSENNEDIEDSDKDTEKIKKVKKTKTTKKKSKKKK